MSEGKPVTLEEVTHAVEQAMERLDARERAEKAGEREKAAAKEALTARVSVAAICLTMLMSFLNFARSERDGAAGAARHDAAAAKDDAEDNWAYYQTRTAERSNYVVADDALQVEVANAADEDVRVRQAAIQHADYVARIAEIDNETRQVFFVTQDLMTRHVRRLRNADRIDRTVARYDVGTRVLTLAVVLFSITLLANRRWLFWAAIGVALSGAGIAISGYFLA